MRIKIFWDQDAPRGLESGVEKRIRSILGSDLAVEESCILLSGYDRGRDQYDAQKILSRIQLFKRQRGCTEPILLVVPHDLSVRGQDFVFGLARQSVGAAVVSTARLDNGYYGRTREDSDLTGRIAKEGAHEIGHLFGLEHCADPECVMFPPRTLGELDRKKLAFCPACGKKFRMSEGVDSL
ncbi:MAG TPA: archaemetzincin family Zn-dependent metalloprotease [Methanomicrobiales archaeon]|nr:archaemetzincin family Zn-dependent metalloprotease [Methanomicrobiales archaeon]